MDIKSVATARRVWPVYEGISRFQWDGLCGKVIVAKSYPDLGGKSSKKIRQQKKFGIYSFLDLADTDCRVSQRILRAGMA